MNKDLWAAIALMMALVMAGCSKDDSASADKQQPDVYPEQPKGPEIDPIDPQAPEPEDLLLTRAEMEMVEHSNDFAFNLFREVTAEYGFTSPLGCVPPADYDEKVAKGNNILSPISIIYALGMLNNGATGETQQQINKVLSFVDTGVEGINTFCKKMLLKALYNDPDTKLNIANNIYFNTNTDYELNPTFLQLAKENYGAEPELRDFNDGKTMDAINQWCSDHTEKMIEKVLDENSFNPSAVSYLLNAIYFKGNWRLQFEEADTQEETFGPSGVALGQYPELEKRVPMMHLNNLLCYTENEVCQAVKLPYGNGSFAMTVLLPLEGKHISDVLQTLTADSWTQQYYWMGDAIVDLKLPRFEADTDLNLNGIMSRLGMPKAFTGDAEFPNFCNTDIQIDLMKQVAKIKVNETGTEAAAVTVIEVGLESAGPEPEPRRVNFHATRPFLYVISDEATDAILFIGQYTGI